MSALQVKSGTAKQKNRPEAVSVFVICALIRRDEVKDRSAYGDRPRSQAHAMVAFWNSIFAEELVAVKSSVNSSQLTLPTSTFEFLKSPTWVPLISNAIVDAPV
jgi:hypothetical protein